MSLSCLRRLSRGLLLTSMFLTGLLSVAAIAQADAPVATPPVPLLWKVSDADNAVYLLGSFHLLTPQDYPLSPDVEAAVAEAKTLVFEIPPAELSSPAFGLQMGQAGMRTDGTRLDSDLDAGNVKRLAAWTTKNQTLLQGMGLNAQSLQLFDAWFVGLTVSVAEMVQMGLDPKLGLDNHLAAEAARQGKPTMGLETGAQQVAFFDGMEKADQVQFLDESLAQAGEGQAETRQLHAAWRAGQAEVLWSRMGVEMKREYPRLYQRINVERNDAWMPKIEQFLSNPGRDDTLVVVGALHLLGPDGVVEKLKAKGYAVERICSACAGAR